jgi:hypothetical protein
MKHFLIAYSLSPPVFDKWLYGSPAQKLKGQSHLFFKTIK